MSEPTVWHPRYRGLGRALLTVVGLALLAPAPGSAWCSPERQERTAYQVLGECCGGIGSNGGWVDGGRRLYRKQERFRVPDCSWTNWTFFGPHWYSCVVGETCWQNAALDSGAPNAPSLFRAPIEEVLRADGQCIEEAVEDHAAKVDVIVPEAREDGGPVASQIAML